ncbi:MAG: hypothetical protein Unbinned579contig1003_23 [Prokaryotic dsDNA virus sp.]|nr:MAG: hypothetical protein Unbinned579contig1003_23 [Prokaryotic dsDNA virus sp.]|tara:strand:+ start:22175 stop:22816 length:642 start_codon:yes stop_codon:yes gene_type:complete
MKVKIKNKGKTKEFKLIDKWTDVTLEKWAELVRLNSDNKGDEAIETIEALSDIPKKIVAQLSVADVALILHKIAKAQKKTDDHLKRIITIEGEDYGFHPDLEELTIGEYADLEHFLKQGVENTLPEIMAIFYRPITERKGDLYTIEAYDGNITMRAEKMKQMSAEQVQSALVFFWTLGKELWKTMLLCLMAESVKTLQSVVRESFKKDGGGLE